MMADWTAGNDPDWSASLMLVNDMTFCVRSEADDESKEDRDNAKGAWPSLVHRHIKAERSHRMKRLTRHVTSFID
jgi:hypothetical protein